MPGKPIGFETIRALALALPGVEESSLRGSPSLKVAGRLLACPALHRSAEPESLVVRIGFEQRASLLAAEPDRYYVTDHYAKHPVVLVRLRRISPTALGKLLSLARHFMSLPPKPGSRASRRKPRR